jgi:hypothetical protein
VFTLIAGTLPTDISKASSRIQPPLHLPHGKEKLGDSDTKGSFYYNPVMIYQALQKIEPPILFLPRQTSGL